MNIMSDIYNKIQKLDLSKWVLTNYFPYTSIVLDRFGEYDSMWHKKEMGDPYIKEIYEHFRFVRNYYCGFELFALTDNKTVFEIANIETHEKLYIGMHDGIYSIGNAYQTDSKYHTEFGKIK